MGEFKMYVPFNENYHPATFKGIFDFETIYVEEDPNNPDIIYMEFQMEDTRATGWDNWSVEINLKKNTIKGLGMKKHRDWINYCKNWYLKAIKDEALAEQIFFGRE